MIGKKDLNQKHNLKNLKISSITTSKQNLSLII